MGDLRGDRFQTVLADDVAVGDSQHLAVLESAQGAKHRRLVIQGRDLAGDILDQGLAGHRLPLRQTQEIVALRVGHQEVAEVLARGKDLQKCRQSRHVALKQRA